MTRFSKENTRWLSLFDDYLLSHVDLLDGLPEDLYFILMPEEDPELAYYNAQVANRNIEGGQTPVVVHIRMEEGKPSFHLEVVEDLSSLLLERSVP